MEPAPTVELTALDQLWFQVAGTVCNLECRHCFISCSPDNRSFWFMDRSDIQAVLQESIDLGVKEYFLTGGEPFLHREIVGILQDTLAIGPATVLTNATLLTPELVESLVTTAVGSAYSLEFSVGLDGYCAATNDAIRVDGAFARTMRGIEMLAAAGFMPIIAAMQTWPTEEHEATLAAFAELLARCGYNRPRIKILPRFHVGGEATRSRPYRPQESLSRDMAADMDMDRLLCSRSRLVTAAGVFACPVLLGCANASLGNALADAVRRPATLDEQTCYTCYRHSVRRAETRIEGRNVA